MVFRKLDIYVGKLYFRLLLIILLGVVVLFVVVNFFENIEKFVSKGFKPISVLKYYAYQIPYLSVLMFPVANLLAVFFVVGELSRNFEIVAVKSSGISMKRFFLSIYTIAILSTIVAMFLNMYVVGSWMKKAERVLAVEIEGRKIPKTRTFASDLVFISGNKVYYFRSISAITNRADGIIMVELEREGRVSRRVESLWGVYDGKVWTLYRVHEFIFTDSGLVHLYKRERIFKEMEESPFEFLKETKELQQMNVNELVQRIDKLSRSGFETNAERTELYIRLSFPFMNIIIVLLALPIAVAMGGRGRAWGFGISVVLVFVYWGLSEAFRTLGMVGKLDPLLSAVIPNLIFLSIAIPGWFRIEY